MTPCRFVGLVGAKVAGVVFRVDRGMFWPAGASLDELIAATELALWVGAFAIGAPVAALSGLFAPGHWPEQVAAAVIALPWTLGLCGQVYCSYVGKAIRERRIPAEGARRINLRSNRSALWSPSLAGIVLAAVAGVALPLAA